MSGPLSLEGALKQNEELAIYNLFLFHIFSGNVEGVISDLETKLIKLYLDKPLYTTPGQGYTYEHSKIGNKTVRSVVDHLLIDDPYYVSYANHVIRAYTRGYRSDGIEKMNKDVLAEYKIVLKKIKKLLIEAGAEPKKRFGQLAIPENKAAHNVWLEKQKKLESPATTGGKRLTKTSRKSRHSTHSRKSRTSRKSRQSRQSRKSRKIRK